MAAVSAVVGYVFYLGFVGLFNLPLPEKNLILVVVIVAIVLFLPTVLFLYLSALRSGLVALRASGPPNFGTLAKSLFRLMRFNFMLINLLVTLFGTGLSVVYLSVFAPDFIEMIRGGVEFTSRASLFSMLRTLKEVPLVITAFFALGVCLANGATGVSMAATAATASVRAPGHDLMWGLGRWFGHLFTVSVLFLLVPVCIGIGKLGGLEATMSDLATISTPVVLGIFAYLIWVGCFFAAAKSEAYVLTAQDVEHEHEEMMEALSGAIDRDDSPDLRSIIDTRLATARSIRKSKSRVAADKEDAGSASATTDIDGAVVDLRTHQESIDRPEAEKRPAPEVSGEAAHVVPFPAPDTETGQQAHKRPGDGRQQRSVMHREDGNIAPKATDAANYGEEKSPEPEQEASNLDSFDADDWVQKFSTDGKSDAS